jgi:hypothetical protein
MRRIDWQRFGNWLHTRRLIKSTVPATNVMTSRYLPARCKTAG